MSGHPTARVGCGVRGSGTCSAETNQLRTSDDRFDAGGDEGVDPAVVSGPPPHVSRPQPPAKPRSCPERGRGSPPRGEAKRSIRAWTAGKCAGIVLLPCRDAPQEEDPRPGWRHSTLQALWQPCVTGGSGPMSNRKCWPSWRARWRTWIRRTLSPWSSRRWRQGCGRRTS